MGLGSSKAVATQPAAPSPPPAAPTYSAEAVDALCRDAYAAGASDADIFNAAQREAMQRQDGIAGVGACMLTAWLAYVYGRKSGTQFAEETAAHRYAAQQQLLDKAHTDVVALTEENRGLAAVQQEQQLLIQQQRGELQRAAQERRSMQQSMQVLRRRNASVRKQLRGLTASLHTIQRQMYAGMFGAGVVLLAVLWSTRPLRHHRRTPPAAMPAEVAEVVVLEVDAEPAAPQPEIEETKS